MSPMVIHDTPFGMNDALVAGKLTRARPDGARDPRFRAPRARDCVVFFVVLPLGFALWATAIGMAPAADVGFGLAFPYIASQALAAWWADGLGSLAAARLLARRRPPAWLVAFAGFWVAWIPLIAVYEVHLHLFSAMFPEIGAVMARPDFALTAEYFVPLVRYSTPFLPLWIVAIYGYRLLAGVEWFAPAARGAGEGPAVALPIPQAPPQPRPLSFLAGSRLPPDAVPFAIKAEEHYVQVWTDHGTDLLRCRFRDVVEELDGPEGARIHRSWWVRWDCIEDHRSRGRSVEVRLRNGLVVPVSLAYKAAVMNRLRTPR